jgi:hypothetical protein
MLTFGTPATLRVLPSIRNDTTFFLKINKQIDPMILSCLYLSWEKLKKIIVAIWGKKKLAPVRFSFFTSIFSFAMLTSSA